MSYGQCVLLSLLDPLVNDKIWCMWGCDKRMTLHCCTLMTYYFIFWQNGTKWWQAACSPCSCLVTSWLDCLGLGAEQWVWRYRRSPAADSSAASNTNTEMVTPGAGHRRSWEVMCHDKSLATDQWCCPLAPAPPPASPPGIGTRLNIHIGRTLLTRSEVICTLHSCEVLWWDVRSCCLRGEG